MTDAELRRRARRISLLLTDCDGVLTDNGVYYSDQGEVMKRFSMRDGMGVERLRNAGIQTGIVSGESSPSIRMRGEKLGLEHVYLGVRDKRTLLLRLLADHHFSIDRVAYIGDDVNDLAIINELHDTGLTAAPSDAIPSVQDQVHYVCGVAGGQGAFRDFAEWILTNRLNNDNSLANNALSLVTHTSMD